jgi:hypothetical protein
MRWLSMADFQGHHFIDSQAGAVGQRQCGLMLEVAGRGNQAADFLAAQDHRQLARQMHRLHLGHQVAAIQRDVEEKLQPADGGSSARPARCRDRPGATGNCADPPRWRYPANAQILREVAHGAHVVQLRLLAKLAHPHVVEHALAQRADARLP